MKITPFAVEQWMTAWETKCRYNLAESCVESMSVDTLLELAGKKSSFMDALPSLMLTYGDIEGSERLRVAVATLYERQEARDVLITHGGAGANALVYQALVNPGDRVVTIVPTYQQHSAIPESLGADVQRLALRWNDDFRPDLDELRALVTPGTKLIVLSNPNNPTGSEMDAPTLQAIADIAARVGAYVLCDEVYRGTSQDSDALPVSMADLYDRGISVGSMSKAFSLAGLRLGWICGPREVLRLAALHRDYHTISVGRIDDLLSAIALEAKEAVLARSRAIVRANLRSLDDWMRTEPLLSYVKPQAGTIALLKYDLEMPSETFCLRLLGSTGVLFSPGSAFEMEGTVRIGYGNNAQVLSQALREVSTFLRGVSEPTARRPASVPPIGCFSWRGTLSA